MKDARINCTMSRRDLATRGKNVCRACDIFKSFQYIIIIILVLLILSNFNVRRFACHPIFLQYHEIHEIHGKHLQILEQSEIFINSAIATRVRVK